MLKVSSLEPIMHYIVATDQWPPLRQHSTTLISAAGHASALPGPHLPHPHQRYSQPSCPPQLKSPTFPTHFTEIRRIASGILCTLELDPAFINRGEQ
jgi:hypothetical protein